MYKFSFLFLTFIIYSLFGYLAEMTYTIIKTKKVLNRGFLCGPIIPIYGLGAVLMVLILNPFKQNMYIVFFLGLTVATVLEYVTGFLLEKIFHNKWWDYSDNRLNLHGYICLLNSILFGLGALFIIYMSNPVLFDFLNQLKPNVLIFISVILFTAFILDITYSIIVAYNLRHRIIIVEELKKDKLSRIPIIFEKKLKNSVKSFKRYPERLLKAFPYLRNAFAPEFLIMKEVQDKKKKSKSENKKIKTNNTKKKK